MEILYTLKYASVITIIVTVCVLFLVAILKSNVKFNNWLSESKFARTMAIALLIIVMVSIFTLSVSVAFTGTASFY